jgi:hypothetical protein
MWTISRQYQVEQCADANAEINRQLGGSPLALPEGITVHRFSVRLTLDEQTRNYLQQQRNHGYESAHTMRQLQLTERALAGENGLLVMHLTNHREDTASIIQLLANDRTTNENRRIELIRELIDKGFIQDADLDAFTRSLVQQSTAAFAAPSGAPQFGALTSSPHTGGVVPGAVAQPTPIAAPQFTPTSQVPAPPTPAETQQSTSDENKRSGGVAEWTRVGKNKSQ